MSSPFEELIDANKRIDELEALIEDLKSKKVQEGSLKSIYLVHYCMEYEACKGFLFFKVQAEAEKAMTVLAGTDYSELIEWSGGDKDDYKELAEFTRAGGMRWHE